jgi:hypothetical protein
MFYSLKIIFRNLKKSALYSWIDIIGLAISLTAVILIRLWIKDETSYDRSDFGIVADICRIDHDNRYVDFIGDCNAGCKSGDGRFWPFHFSQQIIFNSQFSILN